MSSRVPQLAGLYRGMVFYDTLIGSMKTYYVYILRCNDESLYTGITSNEEKRIADHQQGLHVDCYTYSRRPVTLVYKAEFSEVMDAIRFEKQLKRWSRKKKEALIEGREEDLKLYAKKKFKRN